MEGLEFVGYQGDWDLTWTADVNIRSTSLAFSAPGFIAQLHNLNWYQTAAFDYILISLLNSIKDYDSKNVRVWLDHFKSVWFNESLKLKILSVY